MLDMSTNEPDKISPGTTGGQPGQTEEPPPRRDQIAIQVVLDQSPQLHINSIGIPMIALPLKKTPGDIRPPEDNSSRTAEQSWPLRSRRVQAEIADLIYSEKSVLVHQQEINRILKVLEGRAWKEPSPMFGIGHDMDENPLIEAIMILLLKQGTTGGFEGSCTTLLHELKKVCNQHSIDADDKYWPRGAAQLSRKLLEQAPVLERAGITIHRSRRPGGDRYISLRIESEIKFDECDDTATSASQAASEQNPESLEDSEPCDAGDNVYVTRLKKI